MPGEVKLKPCPFCGGKAYIGIKNIGFGLRDHWKTGANCETCGAMIPKIEGVHELWNRRTPEPGTSVIRWTRYDGELETLPNGKGRYIVKLINGRTHTDIHSFNPEHEYWYAGKDEILSMDIGDLWAYLPEPPEVMK